MRATMAALLVLGLLAAPGALALSRYDLYTFGRGLDNQLPNGDEVSSDEIPLNVPVKLFGEEHNSVYVNNNGLLSFSTDIPSFINQEFPLGYPIVSPFYANVDTSKSGTVYYREAHDAFIKAKARDDLRLCFPGDDDFEPESVFIATWADVGYHKGGSDKVNTFQSVIISNGNESFVIFLYPEDGIQWIQATPKHSGLADARAQIGITAEEDMVFILKSSGKESVRTVALSSNCGEPGKYIFRVGNVVRTVEEPELFVSTGPENQSSLTCATGGLYQCHHKAQCTDRPYGFCCTCSESHYGNGRSCLKKDLPLRVNGKISSEINGEFVEDIDLQAYVVTSDGKTYTALSNVPEKVGYSMQTLNILGGVLGWLFAKPIGKAKNGYQLTGGVFNHTSEITFTDTNERVTITQHYLGLDLFDQLKMKATVKGSIPRVPPSARLEILDYVDQYSMPQPGLIMAQSTRTFKVKDLLTEYPLQITQTINYQSCPYLPREEALQEPVTLRVAKNFLGYEIKDRIVRYGMSNKVIPLGQEDPCIAGRRSCGPHSSCVVEDEDSFKCVCNTGYQRLQLSSAGDYQCIDVNECSTGTHSCDPDAFCINREGSYDCQCNPGYEGNGRECTKSSPCNDFKCDPNAECFVAYGTPYCRCKEGYDGDGRQCYIRNVYPEPEPPVDPTNSEGCEILHNCSPFAACIQAEENSQFFCECNPGYTGDGYACTSYDDQYDRSTTDYPLEELVLNVTCAFGDCWCPLSYQRNGDFCYKVETTYPPEESIAYPLPNCWRPFACSCISGYEYNNTTQKCHPLPGYPHDTKGPSGIPYDCNVLNNCHAYAQCVYDLRTGKYECQCTAGFEGDGKSCDAMDLTCEDDSVCDIHAHCNFDPATTKSICICNPGYQGDGHYCTSNGCTTSEDCDENAECRYSDDASLPRKVCACKRGYVKDDSDACVPDASETCNGVRCAENATCLWDSEYEIHYCSCLEGFLGDGLVSCSMREADCNTLANCDINALCEYEPLSGKYSCICREGYFGDGYICNDDVACDQNPYLCSSQASCIHSPEGFVCECNQGFTGNGTVCKRVVAHEGNFLLLNQGMATLRIPLDPSQMHLARPIQISHYQMAIGLAIDCLEGKIYWSDITGREIKSSNYDGTMIQSVFTQDIISPEGLSIDWVSRNIYWTDSRRDTVEVASLNTLHRKVLVNTNLVDPRGIAVHPFKGKVFWSDWNRKNPKIEWSNMDGSEREMFLDSTSVTLPNSLAIDWDTDELCYADAGRKTIECVHIDTMNKRTVATNCTYPFGLAVTPTHYYWSDWFTQKIESLDKRTRTRQPPIDPPLGGSDKKLYAIAAVPEKCPPMSNICQNNNGQCSTTDLCLLDGKGGRTCACGNPPTGSPICY